MTEIGLGDAQRQQKPKKAKQPKRRAPQPRPTDEEMRNEGIDPEKLPSDFWEQARNYGLIPDDRASNAEPVDAHGADVIPDDLHGHPVDLSAPPPQAQSTPPVNPYAPTGWRKRQRVEFDVTLPSGQLCRVARLERDDLIRMNIMEYLDTFTPMLLEGSLSDDERKEQMTDTIKEHPEALTKMLQAIDKVVLACTIKPKITEDPKRVNYGTESDWQNPNFVPVAHLDDIDTFDRMYIFGEAFGRDMDQLKSVLQQAQGMDGVPDITGV